MRVRSSASHSGRDTYAAGAIETIARYVHGKIDEATVTSWVEDLRALAARDEYFFSLDRSVFELRRPVRDAREGGYAAVTPL